MPNLIEKKNRNNVFIQSQSNSPQDINNKVKNKLVVKEPSRHPPCQVIKVNSTSNGQMYIMHLLKSCSENTCITSIVFLPQIHNLTVIMGKHQTNPSWGAFYKITNLQSSKVSNHKTQKIKGDQEVMTIGCNTSWISSWIKTFFSVRTSGEIWVRSIDWTVWHNISFLILIVMLWFCN